MKSLSNPLAPYIKMMFGKGTFTTTALIATLVATAQNPTSPALDFNVFVKNGMRLDKDKTYGPMASGGDLTLEGDYKMAFKSTGSFKVGNLPIGLLVGGKVVYSIGNQSNVVKGYLKIGNATGTTVWYTNDKGKDANVRITPGTYSAKPNLEVETKASSLGVSATNNPVIQGNLINFAQAFTAMQASSTAISAYGSNVSLSNTTGTKSGSTISSVLTNGAVKVTLKTGINVLNTTGAEINSVTNNIHFANLPSATQILIINVNAPGTFVWEVWNQPSVGTDHAPYILYNFYNTTNLKIEGSNTVEGTVFAPFADITKSVNNNHIDGQVIGLSLYHAKGEIRYAPFVAALGAIVSAPTAGSTQSVCTDKAITSVKLEWTKGNGNSRLVICQKGSKPGSPANGHAYGAANKFGTGEAIGTGFVVYNGSGDEATVTGLEPNTTYYFSVIEYNTSGATTVYANSLKSESSVTTLADSDGDGVPDGEDEYPLDASKAFNNMFPGSGFSTLMFEDLWPYKGDYDFNDVVIDYRINTLTNSANNIAEIEFSFVPKACGSTFKDGFAFQLDGFSPAQIVSVSGTKVAGGFTTLNSNGTEAGHPTHANIVVFDDAFKTFNNIPAGTTLVNTFAATPHYIADTIKVIVKIQANAVAFSALTAEQFNPYIIINQTRGRELHLADHIPSAKMDYSFFGKGDDKSNVASGKYFKTNANLPWALQITASIPHVLEQVDFTKAYLNFVKWASSNGGNNKDWYIDSNSNRDNSKLYKK